MQLVGFRRSHRKNIVGHSAQPTQFHLNNSLLISSRHFCTYA
jgi:hypothetical protein